MPRRADLSQGTRHTHLGEDLIEGDIRLVRVNGGVAYFELTLKRGLIGNGNMRPVIKLHATQDGVESDLAVIAVYIPREDVLIKDLTVLRGDQVQLVPIQNSTDGEAPVAVEYRLPSETSALGVQLLSDGYISIPRMTGGGTVFTVQYRAIESNGRENEWKTVTCTVAGISESGVYIFSGTWRSGFNIVYATDSGKVQLNTSAPQIMVGRYADIDIRYGSIGESVSEFGLSIASDENGVVYEDGSFIVQLIDADTVCITAKSGAEGGVSSDIKITVKDGELSHKIDIGRFQTFRSLPEKLTLEFNTMTKNGQSIYDLVKNKSVDDNTNYKIGDL